MRIEVAFPGGLRVEAGVAGHVVATDQAERHGGEDSAPSPFDLFLASLATCSGFYALRFCQQREIDTGDLGLTLETVPDEAAKRTARIVIRLRLPDGFPDKYRAAIVRAVDQCAVKRHLLDPPELAVEIDPAA